MFTGNYYMQICRIELKQQM